MQIEQLAKRVGVKIDKDPALIEEIHRSMCKFLLEHFKVRDARAVNCIHLGKFLKNNSYDELGNPRKHIRGVEESDISK